MVRVKKHLGQTFTGALVAIGVSSSSSAHAFDVITKKQTLDLSSIETHVADRLISQHIPGAALIIVQDGKLVDLKCYGYRDFPQMLPVTPLTPFCIGACTQAFTAMAAEMAVDAGLVSLNDDPKKYLSEFKLTEPPKATRLTLGDYLSQRNGLEEPHAELDWNDTSPKKMIHVISGERPTNLKKKKPSASDMNYCIAGFAVAEASGTTFDNLIAQSIFRPLAMNDSRIESSIHLAEDARGHVLNKHAQPVRYDHFIDPLSMPSNGILSSPRDMAKWLAFLTAEGVYDGKRLISERGFKELIAPIFGSDRHEWAHQSVNGNRIITHSGGTSGYCASVSFLPAQHVGVVLLTNLGTTSKEVEDSLPAWILSQVMATQ